MSNSLKLEDPDRLQGMESLRLAAYSSFNDRRSYEWKLSLAIWTALAVLIVGLAQPSEVGKVFPLHGRRYGLVASILGICLIAVHIYFNNRMAWANAIDKDISLFYSKRMRAAIGLDFPQEIVNKIKKLPKRSENAKLQWLQWGHLSQIVITVFLTILAVALVWLRATA